MKTAAATRPAGASSRQRGIAKGIGGFYRLIRVRSRGQWEVETASKHSERRLLTTAQRAPASDLAIRERSAPEATPTTKPIQASAVKTGPPLPGHPAPTWGEAPACLTPWYSAPAGRAEWLLPRPAPNADTALGAPANRRVTRERDSRSQVAAAKTRRGFPSEATQQVVSRPAHPQPLVEPQVRHVRQVPARTTSAEPQLQQTSPEWFEAIIR
jgi:hypothetical protein